MSMLLRAAALGCACVAVASGVRAQNLEIHTINVGWGSSVFVRGPDGTTVLLEAGDTGKGTARVVPYLQAIGVAPASGLDYTIVGHQHCDHLGGLDEVVAAGYDVHLANFDNGSNYTTSCVTQWNAAAASTSAGAPVAMPLSLQLPLGNGARLVCIARNGAILGGQTVGVSDENDRSIAVLVQYGGFDYLWASDLGGGNPDTACTGRSTSQMDVESLVVQAILPGGAAPLISEGGIDALYVSHHGSESSTNKNWMNHAAPAVALISTGAGQSTGWDMPRIDVVEHVLQAQSACISVPATLVLQTEEGAPAGSSTSHAGYCVGDIVLTTGGTASFTVSANGHVSQGPNELVASALPRTFALDDVTLDTTPPAAPQGLHASATSGHISLAWSANSEPDLAGYFVFRSNAWNGTYTQLNAGALAATGYTDLDVGGGATYFYELRAVDHAGNPSGFSAIARARVPRPSGKPWINELHYDNAGSDTGEFVEIAGPAQTSLAGWQLWAYDGATGMPYAVRGLSGTLPAQQNGFGTRSFAFPGLQDGAPDGIALINARGEVVEFLSYEGSFVAAGGPALGTGSTDIGVSESPNTASGLALRRTGNGCRAADFTWQMPAQASPGAINAGQSFAGDCP